MEITKNTSVDVIIREIAEKYNIDDAIVKYYFLISIKRLFPQNSIFDIIGTGVKIDGKYRTLKERQIQEIFRFFIKQINKEKEKKIIDNSFQFIKSHKNIVYVKKIKSKGNLLICKIMRDKEIMLQNFGNVYIRLKDGTQISNKINKFPVYINLRSIFFGEQKIIPNCIGEIYHKDIILLHLEKISTFFALKHNFDINKNIYYKGINRDMIIFDTYENAQINSFFVDYFKYYFIGLGYKVKINF